MLLNICFGFMTLIASLIDLREEGQVAGLESPDRLGATSGFQADKLVSITIA
jgi:hypothetical protein